jgi:hypothetical protein
LPAGEFLQEIPGDDFGAPDWQYRSCPKGFIPGTVWDWWKRKQYLEKYVHTAVPYDEVHPRDFAFEAYFDMILAAFKDMADGGR